MLGGDREFVENEANKYTDEDSDALQHLDNDVKDEEK
eukprot:CAMPEP_0172495908 /NCGR_PEP_ID=MMETSP1066-20121228/79717_1 /TAXON_ID=671091 /ORGANISM="Coscinodiscus wailesii, Strain CCMP2513" /LENGTH=36 /DNA_ID= /DNA_START= /DNA_END= /DNA_ORIENTATION=